MGAVTGGAVRNINNSCGHFSCARKLLYLKTSTIKRLIYCNGGGGLVAKSCLTLANPWTVAHQPPLFMGFSRQGYWSGLPFLSPRDLPNPGNEPGSPALQADSLPTELREALIVVDIHKSNVQTVNFGTSQQ